MALGTSVFDAFPNAIVYNTWTIAEMAYSTIVGNELGTQSSIDVIVDEGSASEANASPNAANIASDTLLYLRPEQLPTLDTARLIAGYAITNTQTGKTYEILDAGIGKNQENGVVEHVEVKIRQTGAV